MTEKSLMDRWSLMMKVSPQVADSTSENSWLSNSNSALSTEKKLYAIKISDGELCSEYRLIAANKKKTSCKLQKWIERCKWKLPQAIILFSVLQVRNWLLIDCWCNEWVCYLISKPGNCFALGSVCWNHFKEKYFHPPSSSSFTCSVQWISHIKPWPSRPSASTNCGGFSPIRSFMPAPHTSSLTSSCN